jgi:hydrogenase small subunit
MSGRLTRTPRTTAAAITICPVQPDNLTQTLLQLPYFAASHAPMFELDDLRPVSMFGQTVHEGCDRGGYYEQAESADELGRAYVS